MKWFSKRAVLERAIQPEESFERTLESFDFLALKEVFRDSARRCGVEGAEKAFVFPDGITLGTYRGNQGEAHITLGKIALSEESIRKSAEIARVPFRTALLSVICHEEAHMVGGNSFSETTTEQGHISERRYEQVSGFDRYTRVNTQHYGGGGPIRHLGESSDTTERLFSLFNEGVTDRIGEEAFDEYLKRNHSASRAASEHRYTRSYQLERTLLSAFIRKAARECNVPEDVIWRGIKRGFFESLNLDSPEMKELFAATLPPKILMHLREGNSRPTTGQLLALLADKWSDSVRRRWHKLFTRPETLQ